MRILQNIHLYPDHIRILDNVTAANATYDCRLQAMIDHGLNGTHILGPCATRQADAFLTSTADVAMQRAWAIENGMKADTHPHEVLLAQIEHFKPDVLYTHGSGYFPEHVRRALKGLVPAAISWKAPPDFSDTLQGFDLAVNNFPSSFARYAALGAKMGWFSPGFDDAMAPECFVEERPIDVVFVGGYSRHHKNRARMLEQIALLGERYQIRLALAFDRAARIANTPLGFIPPLPRYRAPASIRQSAITPLYGKDMYRLFSQAKIVVNSAIDVAGQDRGNMRCFEALGCGALMLSDAGFYPEGMENGKTIVTYNHESEIVEKIVKLLGDEARRRAIALAGQKLLTTRYGKKENWQRFKLLVQALG